jgi:uncharacterized protein (TIRG00374 family)
MTVALILMIAYFYYLGPQGVLDKLAEISPWLILMIIILQLTGYFFDSLAWKCLLQTAEIRPSVRDLYSVYLTSFGYGILIPSMSAAETVIRVDLSKRIFDKNNDDEKPITSSAILSSIVLHKMVGGFVNIPIILLIAYSLVIYFGFPAAWALAFMTMTIGLMVIMVLTVVSISLAPQKTNKVANWLLHGLANIFPPLAGRVETWEEKVEQFIFDYSKNFKVLVQHWKKAIHAGLFIFAAILTSWINLYLYIIALSVDIELWVMIAVSFIGGSLNSLPLGIPGMEGIKEIVVSEALRKFLTSHESGAIALLYSFVKFYVPVTLAILLSLFLGADWPKHEKIAKTQK